MISTSKNAALQNEAGVGAAGTVGSIARGRMQGAIGESSRGNWYVRVKVYADTVSPVKMREFRRNYLHHGSSKTFVFEPAEEYGKSCGKSTGEL
jgi:hypothetical protein